VICDLSFYKKILFIVICDMWIYDLVICNCLEVEEGWSIRKMEAVGS